MPAGKSWQGSGALLPTVPFGCFAVTGPFVLGFQSLRQAGACLFPPRAPCGRARTVSAGFPDGVCSEDTALAPEPEAWGAWAAACSPGVSVSPAENGRGVLPDG